MSEKWLFVCQVHISNPAKVHKCRSFGIPRRSTYIRYIRSQLSAICCSGVARLGLEPLLQPLCSGNFVSKIRGRVSQLLFHPRFDMLQFCHLLEFGCLDQTQDLPTALEIVCFHRLVSIRDPNLTRKCVFRLVWRSPKWMVDRERHGMLRRREAVFAVWYLT